MKFHTRKQKYKHRFKTLGFTQFDVDMFFQKNRPSFYKLWRSKSEEDVLELENQLNKIDSEHGFLDQVVFPFIKYQYDNLKRKDKIWTFREFMSTIGISESTSYIYTECLGGYSEKVKNDDFLAVFFLSMEVVYRQLFCDCCNACNPTKCKIKFNQLIRQQKPIKKHKKWNMYKLCCDKYCSCFYKLIDQLSFFEDGYLDLVKSEHPELVNFTLENINIWSKYVYNC